MRHRVRCGRNDDTHDFRFACVRRRVWRTRALALALFEVILVCTKKLIASGPERFLVLRAVTDVSRTTFPGWGEVFEIEWKSALDFDDVVKDFGEREQGVRVVGDGGGLGFDMIVRRW